MNRTRLLILLLFVLAPSAQFSQTPRTRSSSASSGIASNKLIIGSIKREHVSDGCGCTYTFKDDRKRTVYSDDFDQNVWMNIDGRDVKLKKVSEVSVPKGEVKKGQRTTATYVAPGLRVKVETVVGKDYGEGHDYSGTITVMKSGAQQTVRVVGSCGC